MLGDNSIFIKSLIALLLFGLFMVSCSGELDLAHKYDNTESSKPYESDGTAPEKEPEEEPEKEPETEKYFDYGTYEMTDRVDVDQKTGIPRKGYWLDGKITAFKPSWDNDHFTIFWSADASLMQDGCSSPWLEDNINLLKKEMAVIGNSVNPQDGFTDGGQWFIGVHEMSDEKLIGFFHAESHWKNQSGAYKSIGVSYSTNRGKTWTPGERILSGNEPKPAESANDGRSYGLGDGCVVWNEERKSWICYYSGYCPDGKDFCITMAESKDPEGKAGSWKKWDGKVFSEEGCDPESGLGGINVTIEPLKAYHGGNPSVMYNRETKEWMMVYHSWQRSIIFSTSKDGITWSAPTAIIDPTLEKGGAMYPNFISEEGDIIGGKEFRVYYSADMVNGIRTLCYRKIRLK